VSVRQDRGAWATREGIRWRFVVRRSDASQTSKRGFTSQRAAADARRPPANAGSRHQPCSRSVKRSPPPGRVHWASRRMYGEIYGPVGWGRVPVAMMVAAARKPAVVSRTMGV
jgi:hypothetical protein